MMEIGAGLHNVRWLPLQPVEKLNELLNLADVHLLPQRADAADLVMPSKLLWDVWRAGGRFWRQRISERSWPQMVSSCGKVVERGNIQEVAQGLLELLHAPQERKRLGVEARKAALAWDKSSVLCGFGEPIACHVATNKQDYLFLVDSIVRVEAYRLISHGRL